MPEFSLQIGSNHDRDRNHERKQILQLRERHVEQQATLLLRKLGSKKGEGIENSGGTVVGSRLFLA